MIAFQQITKTDYVQNETELIEKYKVQLEIYKKALEENPEREFLVIYNERYHFCLRNKNKTTGAELYDLEIKGGYYKKLKEFGIGISLKTY